MRSSRWLLAVVLFVAVAVIVAEPAAAKPKGIGKRLANGVYASPDSSFKLRVGDWMGPGSHIEERQFGPNSQGVIVADDFGKACGVLRTDNTQAALTLEKVAEDFTVGDRLRDKRFKSTERGIELRLLGINRGGSPIVTLTREGNQNVETPHDLHEAWSLFIQAGAIYRVTSGVTALRGEADSVMFERSVQQLEHVLASLQIAAIKP